MRFLIAMIAGALFGMGLRLSGMADPMIVLGFFDILGAWDPTLAFVMGGALPVMGLAWWLNGQRQAPLFGGDKPGPASRRIDGKLVGGSALFGIGWGMTGLCPAPALLGAATGHEAVLAFVAAMIVGLLLPLPGRQEGARSATGQASGASPGRA